MREEVFDRNSQVVVRIHQTVGCHDSVTVRVGVISGRNVVGSISVLIRSHCIAKRSHRIGRGAIHADLSIPVQCHEGPCGVNLGVHNGQFQAVALGDRSPVVHRCSAQRIGANAHAGLANRIDIDDLVKLIDIVGEVVETVDAGVIQQVRTQHAIDLAPALFKDFVCTLGDPRGRIGVRGTTVRRVVLEAAVTRRVVAGGDDDTVSQPLPCHAQVLGCTICAEDRHRNRGGRSERSACINADINVIGSQDFQSGPPCGFAQRVGVATNEKRAIEALLGSVVDDRLGDCNDVCFIELAIECATAVTGGTKRHPLIGV